MALYQLILAYDGTNFSGFQRQGKARTVQEEFEKALTGLGWNEPAILFAGRTDAGVHASGQVVSFSLDWHHSSVNLLNALNAKLPDDVSVLKISTAEADFHPRYDASSRTYQYMIYQLAGKHPLLERFAWRVWPELNGNDLNDAAKLFIGRHDFSAFGRPMKPGSSTIRDVISSHWEPTQDGWRYEIEANAFLYHMVRRLVYVQVSYVKGGLSLSDIEAGLAAQVKLKPGIAPAHGLTLAYVSYTGIRRNKYEDVENLEDLA
jgi:tRNA pseudouridine38-40 synthase